MTSHAFHDEGAKTGLESADEFRERDAISFLCAQSQRFGGSFAD